MKKLFNYADIFIKTCNWKDLALIKLCLCSIGILIGISASKKVRRPLAFVSVIIFIATYIPIMLKFLKGIEKIKIDN